ncbi:TolC family protein [Adhaeribacter sp. BT258]|uniref:TolC family protein n=1 Tax=Adhaeribacter terrigena TaxID=2793070 RepID=A0ABS1C1U7_9BACT|nr:TolC family protein [Adhaeribacter terrigena]MBK0403352.1 TolC family protein [Adhaeribacter terrigena]
MKTIFKLFLLTLLGFSSVAGRAQNAPQAFSLKQAIDYALQNQERIKIAQNETKIANARIGEIRSFGLPQVNIGAEVGNNFIPQSTFLPAEIFGGPAGQFLPVEFTPKYTGSAAISASQLLFDGSYLIGLKAASTFSQLSQKQLQQTEIEITEQVSKAYYTVLVSQARRELLTANLSRLDTLLKQTIQMQKNGFAEKLDVDRLTVTYNNLNIEQQKTDRLIELSEMLLKFQMGMNQKEPITLTDELANVEVDLNKVKVENFNYANRIEYSILETQRDLATLDIRNIKAGYYPKLALNARYGGNMANNLFSAVTKPDNWLSFGYVGLGLQIPVFDGLSKHYQTQQAKLRLENAKHGLKLTEQSIDLQLNSSSANLTNALQQLESQKQTMALAEDIARVSKIKFQEGVGSNLEIINAETDLREAQTNYYAALFDALIAKVDLDKATGTLGQK